MLVKTMPSSKIRNLVLYPAELRAHPWFSAGFRSFCASWRQPLSGTGRKRRAHGGTLSSQFQSHPGAPA